MNNEPKTHVQPPRLATRFLEWYCAADQFEHIPGDLAELHAQRHHTSGKRSADLHYYWNVIRFLKPRAIRSLSDQRSGLLEGAFSMILSYAQHSVRIFRRQKGYVALNVIGLAVGLACYAAILIFVQTEKSFDTFHARSSDIMRAWSGGHSGASQAPRSWTAHPFGDYLLESIPEVENMTRIKWVSDPDPDWEGSDPLLIRHEGEIHYEAGFLIADPAFFDVFDFKLISVGRQLPLSAPFTCVLTPAMAKKYFGTVDVIGRTISIESNSEVSDFEITGIVNPPPYNSHIQFDALISYATYVQYQEGAWEGIWTGGWKPQAARASTYLLLRKGSDWKSLDAKISESVLDHVKSMENMNLPADDGWITYHLQPLTDIHLGSLGLPVMVEGNVSSMNMFSTIALFILLIACVNYMNLSTARGAERSLEVGVRKVIGARRGQLASQFLSEAVLLAIAAFIVSLALLAIFLPMMNAVSTNAISIGGTWIASSTVWWLFLVALSVGLAAGSYPALVLSAFKPSTVLKGHRGGDSGSRLLRKSLVVGQFVCGIILIVATLVISEQLDFAQNKKLGFDRENVIAVELHSYSLRPKAKLFRDEFERAKGVEVASIASLPNQGLTALVIVPDGESFDSFPRSSRQFVDSYYDNALGLEMIEGRWFDPDMPSDVDAFVINETAAKIFHLENPVGSIIGTRFGGTKAVIGVVKDFHFASLHTEIKPLVLYHNGDQRWTSYRGSILLRLASGNVSGTLAELEEIWNRLEPSRPFEFKFLDDALDAQYRSDLELRTIFFLFAGLGIFISCLGLFGLAAYTAQQRTREIGIRKTLGATVSSIVMLLSKEFLLLVLIAIVIATPLAYSGMQEWLSQFAYQKEIDTLTLLIPGIGALTLAILTVSGQAIKAALTDPVVSLGNE